MKFFIYGMLLTTLLAPFSAFAASNLDSEIRRLLFMHYQRYKDMEYFSGGSLSIYIPNQEIKNYFVGNTSHDNYQKITTETLFQIGSITKSFTAAIVLQLEKENRLKLTDSLKEWLPQYSKWGKIRLQELLNMTSGLPNYSDTPLMNTKEYQDPTFQWTNPGLVAYVYPREDFSPPLKKGYFYTNTGYALTDMIIEKITQHSLQTEFTNRLLKPANLTNTIYPIPNLEKDIMARMAHGYNYNQYDNPSLVGHDMQNNNLSWAAAAGGMLSTSEDIIKWTKALFIDHTILDLQQKTKLTSLISLNTGKPLKETTKENPHGFGLGVAQMYSSEIFPAHAWFYEGQTLGFRAYYVYLPCNNVIISAIFNSATNMENDHTKGLIQNVYQAITENRPDLNCKT